MTLDARIQASFDQFSSEATVKKHGVPHLSIDLLVVFWGGDPYDG